MSDSAPYRLSWPTTDEIDAWYRHPQSLGDRYALVDEYCRHHFTGGRSREVYLARQAQLEELIAAEYGEAVYYYGA